MEADWEIEIDDEAPVIDACWPGFVDLRLAPGRAWELDEVRELPAFAEALERLNLPASPVWTSKCDFWPVLDAGDFDADELDAPTGHAVHASGCYIDLLPRSDPQWTSPAKAAAECKFLCSLLRTVRLRCCRVDFVIRLAQITPDLKGLGITAYLTACGTSAGEAKRTLQDALDVFTDALCSRSTLQ
jgi:hypothetical protein